MVTKGEGVGKGKNLEFGTDGYIVVDIKYDSNDMT